MKGVSVVDSWQVDKFQDYKMYVQWIINYYLMFFFLTIFAVPWTVTGIDPNAKDLWGYIQ